MATYSRAWPEVFIELESDPLAAADDADWIDITSLVRDVQFQHGRSRTSNDFQPGSGQVVLDNRDGQFDPLNTSGPYYGKLKLRRKIKVEIVNETYDGDTGSVLGSTYRTVIAFGWVTSWGAAWRGRQLVDTTVTWTDALGLLSNHDLPDSVWDYRVQALNAAGKVVAWYRWDDQDSTAIDSSGNGNHGRYVVTENGYDPVGAQAAPVAVVRAGKGDPVIPQVERPGLSIGKMVAEAGQPAVEPDNGWRFPCVVTSGTALWGTSFTVECWVRYRAAYSLSAAGLASSTTARKQAVGYWGSHPYSPFRSVGFDETGAFEACGSYHGELIPGTPPLVWLPYGAGGASIGQPSIDDGQVHHMVYRMTSSGGITTIDYFVDGVEQTGWDTGMGDGGDVPIPGGKPMIIGHQHQLVWPSANPALDLACGLDLGDVVVYNEALSDANILANYRAGRWGNLSASADLNTGDAFIQAVDMAGYLGPYGPYVPEDKTIAAGKLGVSVVEYMRLLARSLNGSLWQDRLGELRLDGEGWVRTAGASVQFTLYDGEAPLSSGTGFDECDFSLDDGLLANSWTVNFDAGSRAYESASSIAEHGRYEQSVSTLLVSPVDAEGLSQFLVLQRATPQVEIGQVSFWLDEDSMAFVVANCEVFHRVRVIRTRPDGSTIDDEYWIDSVRHEIAGPDAGVDQGRPFSPYARGYPGAVHSGRWRITLNLSKADWPATPFIIDSSLIEGDDVIWY